MSKYLYHGSPIKLNGDLNPRPSKVIDGEEAVFATNEKFLAVLFISKFNDNQIDLGSFSNKIVITEQYPGAFDECLNASGYLYYVSPNGFHSDQRLGMKNHEFINENKVKILKTEYIDNVYEYLLDTDLYIVTYDDRIEAIDTYLDSKSY
jgi:hypothetical protein